MTTTRSDRLRNDERILRAAARLLASDPSAGIQAVADAAGVARLTVYRRYPDRDALVTALRAAVDAELDSALDDLPPWTGGATAAELVRALARVAVRYPVALLRYAPVPGAPPPADARVVRILQSGQRAGALRRDISAETLNTALFGVLSAVLANGWTGPTDSSGLDGPPDPGVAAATVLTLLLPGMTSPTKG